MSYTIEYDRIFIRSGYGFTPLWLAGDNNVYETKQRRARDWHCFMNLLGVSKDEMFAAIEPMLGDEFQQHWKRNGKWVNDAALKRWVENGCKNAASIEDILRCNGMRRLAFYLHTYRKDDSMQTSAWGKTEMLTNVSTTQEFDTWIADVKAELAELHGDAYVCVRLSRDKLIHPEAQKLACEMVLIKSRLGYLAELPTSSGTSWTKDIRRACEMDLDKANELMANADYGILSTAKLVNAKSKYRPFDSVLRFADGQYAGEFVLKLSRSHAKLTRNIDHAYHYPDRRAAERALKSVAPKFASYGTLEVYTDPIA